MKFAVVFLLLGVLSAPVVAQEYPNRPVKIVVTYTAGGGADTTARIFAESLTALWGEQVIVENRPGMGGAIGAAYVQKSAADGYTLLLAANTHIINQVVYRDVKFDITDPAQFTPIALITNGPILIAVNTDKVKAKDMKEFVSLLKSAPGKYTYSACNVASAHHFGMEMIKHELRLYAVHIPHRGCGPAVADVAAGHVDIAVSTLPPTMGFVKQGKLRAIATLSEKRSPSAPELPTVRESGIPELKDVFLESYYGIMAPGGLAANLQKKLEADVLKVAAMPELRTRLERSGVDMFVHDSKTMSRMLKSDHVKLANTAKAANIKEE